MIPGRPPLAVTLGDPAGIGPEIVLEAWRRCRTEPDLGFVAIGPAGALATLDRTVRLRPWAPGDSLPIDALAVRTVAEDEPITPGQPSPRSGRAALQALEQAAALALAGQVSAVVTAPVSKATLYGEGFAFPGQSEFFAARCGVDPADMAMMLAGPALRTVPATIHLPFRAVPAALTPALIERRARVTLAALRRDFGIAHPRLAVAGLNPHAGEAGALGHEDGAIIAPVVAKLAAEGHQVTGPHPADTLFSPDARASYDAALAMYHDQALIPVKTLDFDRTVNITLGLPIVRTSPDHGTAFDIAGRGLARADSMVAAIRLAAHCADRRRRT